MYGFLVVTHGDMGMELVRVARHILGSKLAPIRAVRVPFMDPELQRLLKDYDAPFEERQNLIEREICAAFAEVDQGEGVFILTDIIGGTAFNVSRRLTMTRKVVLVYGVNLPMLLKLPGIKDLPMEEAAVVLVEKTRKAIGYQIRG